MNALSNNIGQTDESVNIKASLSQVNFAPVRTDGLQVAGRATSVDNNSQTLYNINNENKGGTSYARTDDFKQLQAESAGMSSDDTALYHSGSREVDDEVRKRITGVLQRELDTRYGSGGNENRPTVRLGDSQDPERQYNMIEGVDGQTFRDMFEIARMYTENGELVVLHDVKTTEDGIGYDDCYNYLSDDGLSGFSITPDGDLISVFNCSAISDKSGFLRAIAPIVKEKAKTLDCYISPAQNLMEMYTSKFGFKTASIMDYNMEYDRDNIAENHGMPQVAFMVNTDANVETRHFTAEQYDEALEYRDSFVNAGGNGGYPSLSKPGETPKASGSYNVYGKDIALENRPLAPVLSDLQQAEKLPDNFAPVREDLQPKAAEPNQTAAEFVSFLTGERIDDNTYKLLDRLRNGEEVTQEEIANIKEVKEGKQRLGELLDAFVSENPNIRAKPGKDIGTYLLDNAERTQLREQIIAERLQEGSFTGVDKDGKDLYNGAVRKDKRLDIVIGLPASGKSSAIVNPLSEFYQSMVIDSDIIKQRLPEYNDGWGSSLVHEESSVLNYKLFGFALDQGCNIVLPIVGAKASSVEQYIADAKKSGYSVYLHLNEIPGGKAVGRLLQRYLKEGRFIDPAIVADYGSKPADVYKQLRNRSDIDGYSRWDNDVAYGQRPRATEFSEDIRLYAESAGASGRNRREAYRRTNSTQTSRERANEFSGDVRLYTESVGVSGRNRREAYSQTNSTQTSREKATNPIAPIQEASSKDGAFFDGNSRGKYSPEAQSHKVAPVRKDIQPTAAGRLPDNFAPVREDILPASDRLSELGERYGWLKPGEKPAREVKIPKKTAPDRKVSQTVRTILEAEATPEEAVPTIEALISDGVFSYEVYGDQQAQKDAVQFIQNKGWEKAKEEWLDNIKQGTVNKKNTAIGWMLYNNAANSGNIEQAMSMLEGFFRVDIFVSSGYAVIRKQFA